MVQQRDFSKKDSAVYQVALYPSLKVGKYTGKVQKISEQQLESQEKASPLPQEISELDEQEYEFVELPAAPGGPRK